MPPKRSPKSKYFKSRMQNLQGHASRKATNGHGGEAKSLERRSVTKIDKAWFDQFDALEISRKNEIIKSLSDSTPWDIKKAHAAKRHFGEKMESLLKSLIAVRLREELDLDASSFSYAELIKLYDSIYYELPKIKALLDKARAEMLHLPNWLDFLAKQQNTTIEGLRTTAKDQILEFATGLLKFLQVEFIVFPEKESLSAEDKNLLYNKAMESFRGLIKIPLARKEFVDSSQQRRRNIFLEDICEASFKSDPVRVFVDYVVYNHLEKTVRKTLNLQEEQVKYSAEDMVAYLRHFPGVSNETLDMMHRMAPDIFPTLKSVRAEIDKRLGEVKFERLEKDGRLLARYIDLETAVKFRLQEMLETLQEKVGDRKICRVQLLVGGDGYSITGRTQKYGFLKGLTHRLHLAFKIDSILVEDDQGRQERIYVQEDLGGRRAATPVVIARSKESINLLRQLTANWSNQIISWEKNGLQIDDKLCWIITNYAGDEAFVRLLLGQTTAASMFVSMRSEKDEAFARVLQRVVDKVDLRRSFPVMCLQGFIADMVQKDGLTLGGLEHAITTALNAFGDELKNTSQFLALVKVTLLLRERYKDVPSAFLTLLSLGNEVAFTETVLISSETAYEPNQEEEDDDTTTAPAPVGDKNLNEDKQKDIDPSNISKQNLQGALRDVAGLADWFVGWLAGQKTMPLLPMSPERVFPGLLHLLESVTRFLRDATCGLAKEAGLLEDLLEYWCFEGMIGCTGPMEGNDCRAFLATAPDWLNLLWASDGHDQLERLVLIFRRIYALLRQSALEDAEKKELCDLCLCFAVETNQAFPNSPWRNYLVVLAGELDAFVNGDKSPARMAEDCFEHLIQGLKKCLTSCGGGQVTDNHREEQECQQLRKMMVLTNPLLVTANVDAAFERRKQKCGKCGLQAGHNKRTCVTDEDLGRKLVQCVRPDLRFPFTWWYADLPHVMNVMDKFWEEKVAIQASAAAYRAAGKVQRDLIDNHTVGTSLACKPIIVERVYHPILGVWIVAGTRASFSFKVGKGGEIKLRWNCLGNLTTYKFKGCKSASYVVRKEIGIIELEWERICSLEVSRDLVAPNPNLAEKAYAYDVPLLKIWIPIDRMSDWWWDRPDEEEATSAIRFTNKGAEELPPKWPLKCPNKLLKM